MSENVPFLTVDGQSISADEAFTLLRRHLVVARNTQWLTPIVNEVWIRNTAKREGIAPVSKEELQQAVDEYRHKHGLGSAAATRDWLKEHHLSHHDLEESIESQVLFDRWTHTTVGQQISKYFDANRTDFDVAELSQIVVADKKVAEELKDQLTRGDADFATLARAYSLDSSGARGGYLGRVRRSALSKDGQGAIFAARVGEPIGPLKTDEGYHIILVHELAPAELTAEVEAQIREELLKPVLHSKRQASDIRLRGVSIQSTEGAVQRG